MGNRTRPTLKHISELSDLVGDCIRIGFKLETGVSEEDLIQKSSIKSQSTVLTML
jgi:hypothetical protein